ncbi:MAG: hypothetical protein H7Y07_03780 [Pyrinomonadaceae bacterium]|nr:hypothetical protein [Sphingobacteriaceae bacterium]
MPIEIRELLIRVTIDDAHKNNRLDTLALNSMKNTIVKECTQKVLVKLSKQKSR